MPDNSPNTPYSSVNGSASPTKSAAEQELDQLSTKASHDMDAIKQTVEEDLREVRQVTEHHIDEMRGAANQFAHDQKNYAARQFGQFGEALEKTGAELENSGQEQVARYARDIGRRVSDFSHKIENQSPSEIAHGVERFAREQPVVFLSIAAALGLAASRFLSASRPQPVAEPMSGTSAQAPFEGGE